ncbi:MAG: hypothetical protein PHQ64_01510 [Bacilli bacterium]|nr:hypothetical protein [Bacilli bacterium]
MEKVYLDSSKDLRNYLFHGITNKKIYFNSQTVKINGVETISHIELNQKIPLVNSFFKLNSIFESGEILSYNEIKSQNKNINLELSSCKSEYDFISLVEHPKRSIHQDKKETIQNPYKCFLQELILVIDEKILFELPHHKGKDGTINVYKRIPLGYIKAIAFKSRKDYNWTRDEVESHYDIDIIKKVSELLSINALTIPLVDFTTGEIIDLDRLSSKKTKIKHKAKEII